MHAGVRELEPSACADSPTRVFVPESRSTRGLVGRNITTRPRAGASLARFRLNAVQPIKSRSERFPLYPSRGSTKSTTLMGAVAAVITVILVGGGGVIVSLRVLRRLGYPHGYDGLLARQKRTQDRGGSTLIGLGALVIGIAGEVMSVNMILGGDVAWGLVGGVGFLLFLGVGVDTVVLLVIPWLGGRDR
jgi:hypothetical protein